MARRTIRDISGWAYVRGLHFLLGEVCFGFVQDVDRLGRGRNVDLDGNVGWIVDQWDRPLTAEVLAESCHFALADTQSALHDLVLAQLFARRADGAFGVRRWLESDACRQRRRRARSSSSPSLLPDRDNQRDCTRDNHRDCPRDSHAQSHAGVTLPVTTPVTLPVTAAPLLRSDPDQRSSSSSDEQIDQKPGQPGIGFAPPKLVESRALTLAFCEELERLYLSLGSDYLPKGLSPAGVDEDYVDEMLKRQREYSECKNFDFWEQLLRRFFRDDFYVRRRIPRGTDAPVRVSMRELVSRPDLIKKLGPERRPKEKRIPLPAVAERRAQEVFELDDERDDVIAVRDPEIAAMIRRCLDRQAPASGVRVETIEDAREQA
jgi:hypothetical protein